MTDTHGDLDDDELPPAPRRSRALVLVGGLLGLFVLVIAVLVTSFVAAGPGTPGDDSVAAGLARDMIDHHSQAVEMAGIIQKRTTNSEMRYLATDIILTQQNQIGQFQGWLSVWGLSLGRTGEPMQWMTANSHDGMDMGSSSMHLQANGLMPGMAIQADVNKLNTLPEAQAEILFLQLMIKHHEGGVSMAQVALDETKEPVVVQLAQNIVATQKNEITQMTAMLKERGATS